MTYTRTPRRVRLVPLDAEDRALLRELCWDYHDGVNAAQRFRLSSIAERLEEDWTPPDQALDGCLLPALCVESFAPDPAAQAAAARSAQNYSPPHA